VSAVNCPDDELISYTSTIASFWAGPLASSPTSHSPSGETSSDTSSAEPSVLLARKLIVPPDPMEYELIMPYMPPTPATNTIVLAGFTTTAVGTNPKLKGVPLTAVSVPELTEKPASDSVSAFATYT
jgi:hypothetical protein